MRETTMLDDEKTAADLLGYLEAPLRRPKLVAVTFGVAVLLAAALSLTLAERYRSSTLILVEAEAMPDSLVRRVATETAARQFQTVKQQILSRTRLERVIEELDPYPEKKETATLAMIVEQMRGAIAINVKGNDAFSIEYVHTNAAMARDVANRLATLFIEEASDSRTEQVAGAAAFMGTELAEARRRLEAQEAEIRRFKERNMGRLPEQVSANLQTLQRLQIDRQSLDESIRVAGDRVAGLEKNLAAGSVDTGSELTQLRNQLASLRQRYTEEHPEVRQLSARVERLERQLSEAPVVASEVPNDPALAKARQDLQSLKNQRAALEERIGLWQDRVEQAPRVEQEMTILTRDHNTLRENYLVLLNKKMETERAESLERASKGQQFRILDPAPLPERPFFPNRLLFLAGGMLVGLVLGVGFAVVAEYLDPSLKNPRELEGVVPFPVLATVPRVKGRRGRLVPGAAKDLRSA